MSAVVPGSASGECGVGLVRACYAQSYDLIEQGLERMAAVREPAPAVGTRFVAVSLC